MDRNQPNEKSMRKKKGGKRGRAKWRLYFSVLLGLWRLYKKAQPRLSKEQRTKLTMLYAGHAAELNHPVTIHRVLTSSGIEIGMHQLRKLLSIEADGTETSWFKTGKVMRFAQWILLGKRIHATFHAQSQITDSQEAFIALGGNINDPESFVKTEIVENIFLTFNLGTEADVKALINELDADGGGEVEYDEFVMLFQKNAEEEGHAAAAGGEKGAKAKELRNSAEEDGEVDDELDGDLGDGSVDAERKEKIKEKENTEKTVFEEVDQWIHLPQSKWEDGKGNDSSHSQRRLSATGELSQSQVTSPKSKSFKIANFEVFKERREKADKIRHKVHPPPEPRPADPPPERSRKKWPEVKAPGRDREHLGGTALRFDLEPPKDNTPRGPVEHRKHFRDQAPTLDRLREIRSGQNSLSGTLTSRPSTSKWHSYNPFEAPPPSEEKLKLPILTADRKTNLICQPDFCV